MQEIECISLKSIIKQKHSLWSSYEPMEIQEATELDSIDRVFVEVHSDAITKMAMFIGDKKYSADFI